MARQMPMVLLLLLPVVSLAAEKPREMFLKGTFPALLKRPVKTADDARWHLRALAATGAYTELIKAGELHLQSWPGDAALKEAVTGAYLAIGDLKKTETLCALWGDAVRPVYMELLALTGRRAELVKTASAVIGGFRGRKPAHAAEVLRLAAAFRHLNRFQKAMNTIQEYKTEDAVERLDLLTATGDLFAEKYNAAAALQEYMEALKISKTYMPAMRGVAGVLFAQGQHGRFETFAKEVLAVDPGSMDVHLMLALVRMIEDDFENVHAHIDAVLETNPRHPSALGLRAAAFRMAHRQEEYEIAFKAAEASGYAAPEYSFPMISAYTNDKKSDWAFDHLRSLLAKEPDNADVLAGLGRILLRKAQIRDAKAMLERAHELDDYNLRTFNMLELLDKLEDYARKETEHFVLIYDAEVDEVTAEYFAAHVEPMHAELKALYEFAPAEKAYIFFFPRHSYLAVMTTGLPDLGMPALCVGNSVYCDTPNVRKTQMSMNWHKVIRHELVHVFNLLQSRYDVPHWFTEGMAVFSEQVEHRFEWDRIMLRASLLGKLKPLDKMNIGFYRPEDRFTRTLAYAQGYFAILYIVKNHGFDSIREFMQLFRKGTSFRDAVKPVLGLTQEELQRRLDEAYAEYLGNLSIPPRFGAEDAGRLQELVMEGNIEAGAWLVGESGRLDIMGHYEKDGRFPDALLIAQAKFQLRQGNVDAALESLGQVELEQGFTYYRLKGLCLRSKKQYPEARASLEKAWQAYRWESETMFDLAELSLIAGDTAQYRIWMDRYIRVDDSNVKRLVGYALFLLKNRDMQRTMMVLKLGLMANPSDPDVRLVMGKSLLQQRRFAEAGREYRAAAKIKPADIKINTDLIKVLRLLKLDLEADERLEILKGKHPKKHAEIDALLE